MCMHACMCVCMCFNERLCKLIATDGDDPIEKNWCREGGEMTEQRRLLEERWSNIRCSGASWKKEDSFVLFSADSWTRVSERKSQGGISWISIKNFLNWRIVALRCCVSFCCIITWISYKCTYIPSLLDLPPIHPHPSPPGHHRAQSWPPVLYNSFPLTICFTHGI